MSDVVPQSGSWNGMRLAPQMRPLLVATAAVGCVLVALLAVEYHSAVTRETRLPPPTSPAAAPASHPALHGSTVLPDPARVQEWTQTVLARPLFSQSRRPAATAVSGPQRPRLAGIMIGSHIRAAIFAGADDSRGTVASVGQQAGAWRVLAIDGDTVRVMGPDGVRTLHPARDDAARAADATAAGGFVAGGHPSILDLLRNRPLPVGTPGTTMPPLPFHPHIAAAPQQ